MITYVANEFYRIIADSRALLVKNKLRKSLHMVRFERSAAMRTGSVDVALHHGFASHQRCQASGSFKRILSGSS